MKGTRPLVLSGREKKEAEVSNMRSIRAVEMPWLVMQKKPSVSAAVMSWLVISAMRVGKSWREIRGMMRSAYLVRAMMKP